MSAINSTLSTAYTVLYINFGLNALASLTTLVLLRYMWTSGRLKLNLYTKCVLQMTSYQLMYEISTPLIYQVVSVKGYAQGESAGAFLLVNVACILGGTGSSLWSLMLLVSASFTVYYSRQPTAREQLAAIIVVNALLFGYAIPNIVAFNTAYLDIGTRFDLYMACWAIYDYVRLTLIGLSATVLSYLYYVMVATSVKGQRNRSPLYHLLWKIVPYPIILSVARLGATTYKEVYGNIILFPADASAWQTLWLFAFVLLMPIVGTGCLVAFIRVTSGARTLLIQMLHLECMFASPDASGEAKEQEQESGRNSAPPRVATARMPQLRQQAQQGCLSLAQEEQNLLLQMDEHDLAGAVATYAEIYNGRRGMSMQENEEDFAERVSYSLRSSMETYQSAKSRVSSFKESYEV